MIEDSVPPEERETYQIHMPRPLNGAGAALCADPPPAGVVPTRSFGGDGPSEAPPDWALAAPGTPIESASRMTSRR